MPGAVIAVGAAAAGAAVTGASTVALGTIGAGILGGVVAGAVGFAGAELLGLNDLDLPAASRSLGPLLNARSNNAAIPVIYGTRRVGGVLIAPPMVSGTADEYLHLFLVLGEGEVQAINSVWLDGTLSTNVKYSGLVRINKHLGADAQTADTDAVAEITNWTTDHRLRGVAYIYVRLEYDQNAFSGIPEIHAEVQGQKLYDPRTTLTAFSNNPALAVWDYLVDSRYGLGIASSVLDSASFQAAANYCDQTFTDPDARVIARYTCDGVVDTSQSILANLNALLTACRGMLIYTAGTYKLLIDKTETAAFTFDEDNIVGGWGISLGNARSRFNRVSAHFFNPDRSWQEDLGIADDATSRAAADNGRLLSTEIQLPFTTNIYRAERLAHLTLRQSRQPNAVTFTATLEALENDVGDVVYVTHEMPGWTNQPFRIMRLELTQGSLVAVSLSEYEPTVYGDPSLPVTDSVPPTSLPDPFSNSPPSFLTLSSGANDVFEKAAIKATWIAPTAIFVLQGGIIEIEAKKNADSLWVPVGETPGDVTTFHISPVEVGTSYDVRIRSRSNMGVYSTYTSSTGHVVTGQSTTEKNITDGATVTDGSLAYTDRIAMEFSGTSPDPSLWLNDATFGNKGFQVQYFGGNPRLYVGDGADKYLQYDGTDFEIGPNVEHRNSDSFWNEALFFHEWFYSLDHWGTGTTGAASSVTLGSGFIEFRVDNGASDFAYMFRIIRHSSTPLTWSKNRRARWAVYMDQDTGDSAREIWFGIGWWDAANSTHAFAGFKIVGNGTTADVYGIVRKKLSGSQTDYVTTSMTTVSDSNTYDFVVDYDAATGITLYVDGVEEGTVSQTITDSYLTAQYALFFKAQNTGVPTGGNILIARVAEIRFVQDP